MSRLVATFLGVGLLPKAPGTWGSLFALPAGWALHLLGGFPLLLAGALAVFFLGWWATEATTSGQEDPDLPEIVIDEVAGQWIALLPLSALLWWQGAAAWPLPWLGLLAAFGLFRLFDIWKPGPIGTADRMGTSLGVMLDDVLAGIAAAGVLGVALLLLSGALA